MVPRSTGRFACLTRVGGGVPNQSGQRKSPQLTLGGGTVVEADLDGDADLDLLFAAVQACPGSP